MSHFTLGVVNVGVVKVAQSSGSSASLARRGGQAFFVLKTLKEFKNGLV